MLIDYVNIRQGTDSDKRFSRGNTLPLIQRPFGMAAFTLQTNGMRGNWFYHPGDCSVEGLRLTHQPSPWMGDYGQVLFMPQQEPVVMQRSFTPDGPVWKKGAFRLERMPDGWFLYQGNNLIYQAGNPPDSSR